MHSPRRRQRWCVDRVFRLTESLEKSHIIPTNSLLYLFIYVVILQGQNISSVAKFLLDNQQQYSLPGRLHESERDQIEEEVAMYVRACSANISKLQEIIQILPVPSPANARRGSPSPDLLAHRQGIILILSERLRVLTTAFDRLRSLRFRQLQQEETNRRRRTPPMRASAAPRTTAAVLSPHGMGMGSIHKGEGGSDLRSAFDAAAQQGTAQQAQVQHLDEENAALQRELLSMTDQVQHAERSVREIATLNQMFSTAIVQQAQQIEQLYAEAVAATSTIGGANVQLDKAIRANKAGQKCMFLLFLVASLGLLFLDWWYS